MTFVGRKDMKRLIIEELFRWKSSKRRKPLLLTGVRQCGKTHILKEFGNCILKTHATLISRQMKNIDLFLNLIMTQNGY